eukprot:CAMPEP_0114507850 /NCGR_PEP_ID=MMETSP0109-20121206/12251_1 /TAXON_ID=29199 /ORGANISM="Chlorarachnion reptans, Strain CCCM449" /LENGTH=610 /DNA_ID=CAMNT_0001686673 /DNA_START=210 /DNA_END=2042 /DNA_ORIENTATION=-
MSTAAPQNSLWVGDLSPTVNEQKLYQIFGTVGHINSIRLCRDHHTQRSLGYAYINYFDPESAAKALKTLNFSVIEGEQCRVMWVHRDPFLRKSGKGNIYVKNLPEGADNKKVHEMFEEFGEILSVKVKEKNGKKLNHGFVHFKEEKSAQDAIAKMDGKEGLIVKPFLSQKDRAKAVTNLYVKPLPKEDFSEEDFRKLFEDFGEITSCKIKNDPEKPSAVGFVDFKVPEDAKEAVEKLNGTELKGQTLFVGPFQTRAQRDRMLKEQREKDKINRYEKFSGTNVFVKNLADDIDEKKLNQLFGEFGAIKSSTVKLENGVPRGFGFVNYATPEAATKAVTNMHRKVVHGKLLYVALAQSRDERLRKLQDKYQKQAAMQGMYPGPPAPGYMYPQAAGGYTGRPVFIQPLVAGRPRYFPQGMQRMPNQMMVNPSMRGGAGRGGRGGRKGMDYKLTANARNHPAQGGVMPMPQQMMPMAQNPQYQMQQRQQQMMVNQMAAMSIQPGAGPAGQEETQVQPNPTASLAAALQGMDEESQKHTIGEMLYPKIQARLLELDRADKAGKITGMLLDLENEKLLEMIPNAQLLNDQVVEALEVLDKDAEDEDDQGDDAANES